MKRPVVVWSCDLCQRTVEVPITSVPIKTTNPPGPWMTQEVSSAKDRRRYGINRTFLSFCFTEHKVAFNEAAKAARDVALARAEEMEQQVFTQELKSAKDAVRSAVDRLADLGQDSKDIG